MYYLLLAILVSSLFPVAIKTGEKLGFNAKTVVILNFFFGGLFSTVVFISHTGPINWREFWLAALIAVPTGLIYFLGMMLYQRNIEQRGLSLAALFMKLGLIIPISLSILFFGDTPSLLHYFGIACAIIAIIVINGGVKQMRGVTPSLLFLLIFSGLGDFANKVFENYGNLDYNDVFILFTFFTACLSGLIKDHKVFIKNITPFNLAAGAIIGIINSLSTFFIVLTLNVFPASVAYVIINVSVIVLVSLTGVLFFKDKLKRNELSAFLLAIAAIILSSI